ncbi:heterokaryon incompatibility protein-domain-containing protein [Xylaria acuta]|nr:heterokaryon incompatibility protein-domain-containing protein [Xylaria acuta]
MMNDNLCHVCRRLDLSPLIAQLPDKVDPRTSATEYEERFAVYFDDFSLERASTTRECPLCTLLSQCAVRTGEEKRLRNAHCCLRPKLLWSSRSHSRLGKRREIGARLYHSGQIHVWFHEPRISLKLGPPEDKPKRSASALLRRIALSSSKVNKSSDPESATPPDPEATDTPEHEGGASSRIALFSKKILPIQSKPVTIKSSVAFWMIDIISGCPIIPSPNRYPVLASINVAFLREWLQTCDRDHSHSALSNVSPRLRHIINRGLLRAINTSTGDIGLLPLQTPFVVLSYVWGQSVDQQESLRAMPISGYARTIRDAAELAKSVGFKWLWVDRICIDQANEAEKSALIPYIKDIFAGAELTIVGASGDGAHCGLAGSYNTPRTPETAAEIPLETSGRSILRLVPATLSFNALHDKCVWRTRGWTFQETVFSRRLLYVFPSEMIFSCSKGTCREATGTEFDPKPAGTTWGDSGVTMPIIASELWANFQNESTEAGNMMNARQFVRAVEEYTSRNLTVEADRVAAFAGLIAAATGPDDEIPERALLQHGHPLRFFETALTWQHEEGFQGRHARGECFVPSWSWASAGTKVHFLDGGKEGSQSNWFRFGIVNGFDVLGLPTHDFLSSKLGLNFPTELLNRRPWLKHTPSNAPPSYESTPSVQVTSSKPGNLPQLHLVTVLFDGNFFYAQEGRHCLSAVGANPEARIVGTWSVGPAEADLISTRRLFAVVAGCWSFYIMALQETSEQGVFMRLGLRRVSEHDGVSLFTIMKLGSPRWDYIRLV